MKMSRCLFALPVLLGLAVLITACRGIEPQAASYTNNSIDTMPEVIQAVGENVVSSDELPTYSYTQQEIEVMNNGQRIYGVAYIPETEMEKVPLVISAHGLGGSYHSNLAYAEQLASHGLATYCFDFRGGGGNRSDGSTTEMSVMTEVSDIQAVLDAAKNWDFVDSQKIVLFGASQGGITSAIAAARRTDDVAGLILLYPAFVIHDDIHKRFSSLDEVPDVFQFNWITAGRPYVEDMWDYDVYNEIGNYTGKVLLIHGSADGIVPVSYSDRAAEVYPDAEYYVINGAGHGFGGAAFEKAVNHIYDYLQEIGILNVSNSTSEVPEIKIVPESYNSAAAHPGTVERFEYTSNGDTKAAYVYLPYGYDSDNRRYNILYFMHGGGGNAGQFYNRSYALNDILDHAIENGDIEPLIVVTPTFYPSNDRDFSVSNAARLTAEFHTEFIHDLMPAVESHYRTYAETADAAGLEASRMHRAFGGFSMGSVTTWYQFVNALDYVAYFMPLSGDCWEFGNQGGASHPEETAAFLNDFIETAPHGKEFFIYAMTGSDDIAYNAMSRQIAAMRNMPNFAFGLPAQNGNIQFSVLDGAIHDYTYYRNYIYTILPYFFEE